METTPAPTAIPTAAIPTTTSTAVPAPAAPTAPGPSSGLTSDFDTFLKMLTVQMQNQDPLDPIDSADYAVQLATFSGVEQQVKTNDLLESLAGQMALGGLAQMAGWVGQEARAPMPGYFDGAPITVSPNPLATADAVELVVRDSAGAVVSRQAIPNSAAPIEWAGATADGQPLPAGLYSFEVVSSSNGEVVQTEPAELYATVTEVRTADGQTMLVLEGGATVAASAVTALRRAA